MRTASVIIRTKNEERALKATLERVFGQRVAPVEVIVIDSGSTDGTLDIARECDARLMTIAPREWSYARALNRAAAAANGEILVMLSAHCLPIDDDWLGKVLRHFDDATVAAVWGAQFRSNRPLPPVGPPIRQLPGTYTRENWTFGYSNANGAIRAALWREVPFDESFPAAEDKQWGRAMLERGYCLVHEPAAAVWHDRHSVDMAYRRQRAVMEGFSLMFPEGRSERPRLAKAARHAVVATMRRHARARNLSALLADLRRAPASTAAIIGGLMARRRARGNVRSVHARPEKSALSADEPEPEPEPDPRRGATPQPTRRVEEKAEAPRP